jgi:hypothetical protein
LGCSPWLPLGATGRGPEPGSGLAVGHPEGLALTRARTSSPWSRVGERRLVTVGVWTGTFSVSFHDALSRLICAGWLPQDGVFGWSVTAGLRTNVA